MNTLIIYDTTGYILSTASGSVREPVGIPFIYVDIPIGKRIKVIDDVISLIDVSVTPNVAILEDIPKTDVQILQEQVSASQEMINALMMM